jgi:hypothetical protein
MIAFTLTHMARMQQCHNGPHTLEHSPCDAPALKLPTHTLFTQRKNGPPVGVGAGVGGAAETSLMSAQLLHTASSSRGAVSQPWRRCMCGRSSQHRGGGASGRTDLVPWLRSHTASQAHSGLPVDRQGLSGRRARRESDRSPRHQGAAAETQARRCPSARGCRSASSPTPMSVIFHDKNRR